MEIELLIWKNEYAKIHENTEEEDCEPTLAQTDIKT